MIMEKHRFPSATRVANPLAGNSSNDIDYSSDSATGIVSNKNNNASSAIGAGTTSTGVPNPISSVPNPIMGASPSSSAPNNNDSTITSAVPFSMVSKPAASTAPFKSLVPSPLASPSSSPPHQQEDDEMETRDTSCDEPPKKEQRRRSNSVQWAGNSGHNQQESFEPVNFGDYREKSPRKDSVGSWASCASHDTASTTQPPTPLTPMEHIEIGVVDHQGSVGSPSTTTDGVNAASMGSQALSPLAAVSSDAAIASTNIAANKQGSATTTTGVVVDKRQKRLERNRESARASRRRRKQYLEELESNVQNLSTEMDSGRVLHALEGVKVVAGLRRSKVLKMVAKLNGEEDDDVKDAIRGRGGWSTLFATKKSSGVKHNVVPKTSPPLASMQQKQSPQGQIDDVNAILSTSLSRTQPSFHVVNSFFQQQLKSLILTHKQPITTVTPNPSTAALSAPVLGPLLPSLTPFLLWLTLQNDNFFRGGRAQSERLSAARIGERLLHGGMYRVTPSTTAVSSNKNDNKGGGRVLWPLLCHEIGLSYDQEDKIRTAQRLVLQNANLWVHRHTARAASNVIHSVHDVIGGMIEQTRSDSEVESKTDPIQSEFKQEVEGQENLMSILTKEQRIKFFGWALKNQERLKRCAERKVGKNVDDVGELKVSRERHVAANMYIIDHKLAKIKQRVPNVGGKYVNPSKLKKLGRRPCFESLGGYENNNDVDSTAKTMKKSDSTGALKRSLDEMSIGGNKSGSDANPTAVTPEAAQTAGNAEVSKLLQDVLPIIPKPPTEYQHSQQLQGQNKPQSFQLEPVMSVAPTQVMSSTFPTQPQQQYHMATSNTFDDIPMPTPVSVLLQTPDDFLSPSNGGGMNGMVGGVDPTAAVEPIPYVPEPVVSTSAPMMSRHQSAPQFGQYLSNATAQSSMMPVPEGATEDDFKMLDDLPMDADDWLIGDDTLEF